MRVEIIPAVLESNVSGVEKKLKRVVGKVERVGVDIVDGVFADNLTVAVDELKGVGVLTGFKVEIQLMVEYPEEWLGDCGELGVERVFGHVERMEGQEKFVEECVALGMKSGLALDLYTPVEVIEKPVWEKLDGVLLMSVQAGKSGQEFNERVVEKIKQVRKLGFGGDVQVDGGMNPTTVTMCKQAGANQFGVTSWLWEKEDIGKALEELLDG